MFEAQYLFSQNEVLGPWVSRQADNIRIRLDFIENTSTNNLLVELWEKDTEDTGDGSAATGGSAIDTNATDVLTVSEYQGVKELVRFRMVYDSEGSGSSDDYALFRMLPNVWFDSAAPPPPS